MANTKTKFKGALKATAIGFALVLSSAFFPANAIANAIDYKEPESARINTSRIAVDGNNQSFAVKRGATVSIPEGEYLYKKADASQGTHIIGGAKADNITESEVIVTYKATGARVAVSAEGTFVASKVGTYVITYRVVDNKIEYTYEQLVKVEASEASFEFEANDKNVIPSVYDVTLANGKDVVLPLPTVVDENGETILSAEDGEYYVLGKDTSGITGDKDVYVNISLVNGGESVALQYRTNYAGEKEYYISGEDLSELDDEDKAVLEGQDIKIYYSFYQKSTDVFIASTSKTFTVKKNYYYSDADKDTTGYSLVTSLVGTRPDSAIVGVEKTLPTVSATTGEKNTPASENVEVYYDLVVYKANDNGNYNDNNDVTEDVITKDGAFKAIEEGSYKFVYKVKDFYGNAGSESSTTFTIKNVKDTISATAYIYDASQKAYFDGENNPTSYDEENNKYDSAQNLLKTQTVNRNIVMYAIGGTDNMVAKEDIALKRVIKDNSGIERFVIDQEEYHAYNLIFAPGLPTGAGSGSVLQQIVSDNYQIFKAMTMKGLDIENDEVIAQYLKENGYLIVTTQFNKALDGSEIVTGLTEDDETALIQMRDAGYAYIAPKTVGYEFKEQTYTFYYHANDNQNSNKEATLYQTVKLTDGFTDATIPTLTFATDLQSAYLPTESFEFKVATATDTIDSRLETVTAYRYLGSDRKGLPASEKAGTTSKLSYVLQNANKNLMEDTSKWYAKEGKIESEGWFIDNEATTYTVDLANKPDGANYVEILAYAIDDYGNVGFFNKVIRIADATDAGAPVLYKVINAPDATEYTAPSEIALPTLYFNDDNVNYMHAKVNVYKLIKNADGVVTGKTLVQNSNMKTSYDTYEDYFKVDAGVFKASVEGDYQVAVTVVDSGNHSVTSYFAYKVVEGESTEEPKINNITSDPIELLPGEAHYLVAPTFTMAKNSKYGYIGVEEQDDAFTSTYYNVSAVSATSSDYELDESYFIGNSEGTYQIQYTAFLIQYDKNAVASTPTNGKLHFEDDKLYYRDNSGKDFFIKIDREDDNKLKGIATNGDELDMNSVDGIVKAIVSPSAVQIIKVSEVFIDVTIDDDAYAQDKYAELNQEVKIAVPDVDFKGDNAEMNKEDSTVTITRTSGGTTTTIATISFEKWADAVKTNTNNFRVDNSTGDIYLIMKDHGEYKIKYSIQAMAGGQNVGDPSVHEYKIASGDTIKPEIKVDNKVIVKEKYNIGDKVVINMAGLTVTDNMTTDNDTLLGKLTVTLKNTTLNETAVELENKATEEGSYIYESDKLETAGDYVLTFTVKDEAGNISEQVSVNFEVSTATSDPIDAKEVMGGVLIGVSVALLVGVVGYFVVSKVKLDKKEKAYKNAGKDKKKD
ncbi:MAG: hypothetical protein J6C53_02390 [Clostridia bacterium]|nr:hypothetical protein [Clostridia bacterium]